MPPRTPFTPRIDSPDITALSRAGSPMDVPPNVTAERATVIGIDPSRDAYRVRTITGRVFVCGRIKASPNDNARLGMQSQVCIDYRFGAPYINGILPPEFAEVREDNPANLTDTDGHGGEDPAYQRNLRLGARAPGDAQDLMPGDAVLTSPDNSAVGALSGKVALVRGSPMAQLRAFGQQNLVHMMSGIFRHDSWMGTSEILNESGKTSYRFRGGSDQLTESGPDAEKYTIHLDVGDTGDTLDLRVTSLEGETLFRFHVTAEGALEVFAKGGIRQTGGSRGASHPHQYMGTHEVEVDGAHRLNVSGEHVTTSESSNTNVYSSRAVMVGLDHSTYVNRDMSARVGGNMRTEVAGVSSLVSSVNVNIESVEGYIYLRGNERLQFETNGQALLTSNSFNVRTPGVDSINFGENATQHGVMYESLETALQTLVADYTQFKQAVIGHIHPITTPGSTQVSPVLAPLGATAFTLDLSAARSRWVRLK